MITVVGDVMLDEYWFGSSTRNTPENKNVPVLKILKKKKRLGGAANVALNIKKLGLPVTLASVAGKDKASTELMTIINSFKLNKKFYFDDAIKTVQKIRQYSDDKYLFRTDIEKDIIYDEQLLVQNVQELDFNILVLSDYNKGTIKNPQKYIELASQTGAKTIVDPKKDFCLYKGADVIKPNLPEFLEWANLSLTFDIYTFIDDNKPFLKSLPKELSIPNIIVTIGKKGCMWITSDFIKVIPSPTVRSVDPTGAGDSFIAGLICGLSIEQDMYHAIITANQVAALSTTKKGTSYVRRNEI